MPVFLSYLLLNTTHFPCPIVLPPSIRRMEQTPQQVISDLDILTNELSSMSAVGGRRTRPTPSQNLRTPARTPTMTPRDRHLSRTEGAYQGESVDARNFMREARESSVVMDNQPNAAEEYVPKTAARRNVTSRRSRGRQEGFGKDPHSLVAKQTRGRSRDRAYTRESNGTRQEVGGPALPGPVMLARCKTRMKGEMDHRT
jgi:hypothetical protein